MVQVMLGAFWGGLYTPRWGVEMGCCAPWRLSEAFERRLWASQIFCTLLGPYLCAPQDAGAVAVGSSGRSSRSEPASGLCSSDAPESARGLDLSQFLQSEGKCCT